MANAPHYAKGRYLVEITDQGLTKASTGNFQIVLRFKVLEGTQPQCDVEQYERTAYLAITDNTVEYLTPKLAALGYNHDSLRHLNLQDSNPHDLRGTQVEFFCKHEQDRNNEWRERWDVVTGGAGKPLELKPPDQRELRTLDAMFGRVRKANGAAAPRRQAVSTNSAPDSAYAQELTDADVPF
jgi:hypothetical protein